MRRWTKVLSWISLLSILALYHMISSSLHVNSDDLAARSLQGWAGVIRVWAADGWKSGSGSFIPWLNQCASRFEKKHPGVYLEIEHVTDSMLSSFDTAAYKPDIVFFAPGMRTSGEGLYALSPPDGIREELQAAGLWNHNIYAFPVAMGGYAWAINSSMLEQVPTDWSKLKTLDPLNKQQRYLMQVPADEQYRCFSAALNALCAPRYVTPEGNAPDYTQSSIDLGLDSTDAAPDIATQEMILVPCHLPTLLPDNFLAADDYYSGFLQGLYAAIPVSQWEIRRLQRLSDSGRAPEWAIEAGGCAFTDQLLMAAVPITSRPDSDNRVDLAKEFVSCLLCEECQSALSGIRALRVTEGASLYTGDPGMEQLEAFFSGPLRTVSAFDSSYRMQARKQVLTLLSSGAETAG